MTHAPSDPGDDLRRRLAHVLALDPDAPALEFGSHWTPWRAYRSAADGIAAAMDELTLPPGAQVGLLLRNRPVSVGLVLGVLLASGCVVVLNPLIGTQRLGDDIAKLDLALIAGEPDDIEAVADVVPTLPAFALADLGGPGGIVRRGSVRDAGATARPDTAIRLLTSGTTGPPKRSDLTFTTLQRVLHGAKHYESSPVDDVRLREGVVVVNAPLVHLGGLFRILQATHDGRRISLLERFTVDEWVDRVRRHRPKTASLVPTALRMVLDADLDPADLASLRSVVSGTAPLDPDTADEFTEKYGIPVLTNYAATEFGGGVAGWNIADHRRYWKEKRGSVGRAHAGCALRVVDETTGVELPPNHIGLLEVCAAQLDADEWVRTTDLARIDEDGFLWIVGRADQTIIRGGLKVQPETVRRALDSHPAVRAAAVVGVPDERLGQVPVAVVELYEPATADVDTLLQHAAGSLAPYEVPVAVVFVETLPRTESGKVDLTATRAIASGAWSSEPRST